MSDLERLTERVWMYLKGAGYGAFTALGMLLFFNLLVLDRYPRISDYGPREWGFVAAMAALSGTAAALRAHAMKEQDNG